MPTSQRSAKLFSMPTMQHNSSLTSIACAIAIGIVTLMSVSQLHAQQQTLTLPSLFHFDGTQYVTLANSPALAPPSQVTISAWIKPDFSVTNVVDTILDKRDGCGFNRSYQLGLMKTYQSYTPGTIFFAASNANTDDLFSTVPVPNDGQFHHVAGTYDGTTTKVFLDGVLVGQGAHAGPISTTTSPAVIGVQAGCGDPTYADIGQVKIVNYAVPDNQIMSEIAGFAMLKGGNTFVGNQNVTGVVSAASFVGDGSGLSNLNPSTIASGTAPINISGTAASAINAGNSANLAGITASNYARLDLTNSFQANQSIAGSLSATGSISSGGTMTIGGGTPIANHNSTLSSNIAFNTKLSPTTCIVWKSPAAAADGDIVIASLSNSLMTSNIVYSAFVNAASANVLVRICNPTGAPATIGSGNIRIDVWKH